MFGSKIIQPKRANYIQGGGGGGTGPMGQMGKQMMGMGLKAALSGSPMAPLAGVLGGLFNNGGMVGGPLSKNPNGYNEGGAVMETPIKKVMDEQKLEQQAMAFELEQKRKQEAHDLTMKQKQAQFAQAQKMKAASATTNKTAAKPKGPLSK